MRVYRNGFLLDMSTEPINSVESSASSDRVQQSPVKRDSPKADAAKGYIKVGRSRYGIPPKIPKLLKFVESSASSDRGQQSPAKRGSPKADAAKGYIKVGRFHPTDPPKNPPKFGEIPTHTLMNRGSGKAKRCPAIAGVKDPLTFDGAFKRTRLNPHLLKTLKKTQAALEDPGSGKNCRQTWIRSSSRKPKLPSSHPE